MDLWGIRLECLKLSGGDIEIANSMEQYIKNGHISPEMQALLDEDARHARQGVPVAQTAVEN